MKIGFRMLLAAMLSGIAGGALAAPMSFDEAARRLMAEAPALQAAEAGRRAARAGLQDADRRPNPTAELEVENFAGTEPFRGLEGVEVTAAIEQTFERGGKRRARVAVARAELTLADIAAGAEARRVLAELVRSYGSAAVAATREAIARDEVRLAETLAEQSTRRLAAGDIPDVEHDRALVSLGQAQAELERARRERETAERALALLIGVPEPVQADPGFLSLAGAPDPHTITISVAEEARFAAEAERNRARISAARADRVPDIAVRGGIRGLREEDAVALVAGVSVPLPIFNPGRARVQQVEAEAQQAAFAAEAARRDARRTAERALANWQSGLRTLQTIDTTTIPAAERLLALTERGYRLGALLYRDLADARTSLYAARRSRANALEQINNARADLAEVTGDLQRLGLSSSVNNL